MEALVKNGGFRTQKVRLTQHGVTYSTFELTGYLAGERIRKRFKTRELAEGERNRLEVAAANDDGAIKTVTTRLTPTQLAEAEAVFARLGERSLSSAVDWYLVNYRPPTVEMTVEAAAVAFTADRAGNVSAAVAEDYGKVLGLLKRTFPERKMHTIKTEEIEAMMRTRGQAKKSWNNLRTYLHAIFEFCVHDGRRWVAINPVKAIRQHEIARGLPQILTATQVRELFTYLETYSGPTRCKCRPGYLVPYFALATFAGIRPSVSNGELRKLHDLADKSRVIDEQIGVIRMTPDLTKTNSLRQITIQPNLSAWMKRYPLKEWPLMVENMVDHVARVRKHLKLGNDVLRHTFVSMHVAKFKSLGSTALEAGNSEAIIRKHYLNLVTDAEADEFWAILPAAKKTD
jgi:integrase